MNGCVCVQREQEGVNALTHSTHTHTPHNVKGVYLTGSGLISIGYRALGGSRLNSVSGVVKYKPGRPFRVVRVVLWGSYLYTK